MKPYTPEEVLKESNNAADTYGIPRRLLAALLKAESGLKWNSARYAFRNADGSYSNLTKECELALTSGNIPEFKRLLDTITANGSQDISFGVGQQTVRWANEGDHTASPENVMYIRDTYFDVPHAVDTAAKSLTFYYGKYGDVVEALCRYNKPTVPSLQNPNRSTYVKALAEVDQLLSNTEGTVPTMIVEQKLTTHSTERFTGTPKGFILHGSRSGVAGRPKEQEYQGCVSWCLNNPDDLSWSATIGENKYAIHMPAQYWGWNARKASPNYVAVEFAQATNSEAISDAQVDAFVHFVKNVVQPAWPSIPLVLKTHAEVEKSGETGKIDGKDDVFPFGDQRAKELKDRILSKLAVPGGAPVYEFHFGFKDKADELGEDIVGVPLDNEVYFGDSYSMQMTTKGMMIYSKVANVVQFLPAA